MYLFNNSSWWVKLQGESEIDVTEYCLTCYLSILIQMNEYEVARFSKNDPN